MRIHTKFRPLVAIAICLTIIVPSFGQADGELKLRATEGEGAFNDIKAHTGRGLTVEVRDEGGQPVPGATVSFTAPGIGAGGVFSNGERIVSVPTDALGIASSGAFRPNNIEGRFNVAVAARQGNRAGSIVINQSNTLAGAKPKTSSKKKWIILGALAGGAGAALALGRSSSSPQSVPTVLSPGTVVVGGPR